MSAADHARLPADWQAPPDYLRERVVLVTGAA
ncbi:MAG: short-chain dehydrogenase, partial [Proteobacteria bacterium]|nr:short-chain dehydrogenase [Pseudomonadota bacterium]